MVLVSHDTEFVTELEPDRVLVMPDGTVDHWSDDLVESSPSRPGKRPRTSPSSVCELPLR